MSPTIADIAEAAAAATIARTASLEPSEITTGIRIADSQSSPSLRDGVSLSSNSKRQIAAATIVVGCLLTLAWAGFLVWLALHELRLW